MGDYRKTCPGVKETVLTLPPFDLPPDYRYNAAAALNNVVVPGWWNWQTRLVEGQVLNRMQVQLLSPAFTEP